jgi:hypothetical protein
MKKTGGLDSQHKSGKTMTHSSMSIRKVQSPTQNLYQPFSKQTYSNLPTNKSNPQIPKAQKQATSTIEEDECCNISEEQTKT